MYDDPSLTDYEPFDMDLGEDYSYNDVHEDPEFNYGWHIEDPYWY